jgi:hypothetical protein
MESWRLKLFPLVRSQLDSALRRTVSRFVSNCARYKLWVQIVSATGADQAGQDRGRAHSCEQVVLAIENYALHLVLRDIGVDTDRTIQR